MLFVATTRTVSDSLTIWRWGVDNKERLALAEKIQKDIQKRTLNYRLVQMRDKIEREFGKKPQDQ